MTRWFRFYDDAMHDPKLLRLSDSSYRAWSILLCVASKSGGTLPPAAEIALTLRCKPSLVAGWITELAAGGLLDKTENGFVPHNWNERQYKSDSSAERMKRHRDGKRDVTPTVTSDVTVTVQNRTETETETETEQNKKEALPSVALPANQPNSKSKKRAGPIPDDWGPSLKHYQIAEQFGQDVQRIEAIFRDYLASSGKLYLDYDAAFNQFIRNQRNYDRGSPNGRTQATENLSTVARRHASSGISFGERPPAPSLLIVPSGPDVRLLPQGRSERPGDLCSGDGIGPKRISEGSG